MANRQNELGPVLADLSDPADARAHHERALAIDAAVLGPDHPMVAADRSNLNRIAQERDERARAVEKLKTDACRHMSFGYIEQGGSVRLGGLSPAASWAHVNDRAFSVPLPTGTGGHERQPELVEISPDLAIRGRSRGGPSLDHAFQARDPGPRWGRRRSVPGGEHRDTRGTSVRR